MTAATAGTDLAVLARAAAERTRWLMLAATGALDSCIETNRVLGNVLDHYRISWTPVPVRVTACNPATKTGFRTADVPSMTGRWPGHLVLLTDHWLIDVTADQMNQPGLDVSPGPLTLPRDMFGDPVFPVKVTNPAGVQVGYTELDDQSWKRLPAWRNLRQDKRIAGKIINLLDTELRGGSA